MHPKLQAAVHSMNFYQATFPEDTCIIVTNQEVVVGYKPGKHIDLKIKLGMDVDNFRGTVTVGA